jgi:hypothetical protein
MQSVKAIYENGQIRFSEASLPIGRRDVIVTFLDGVDQDAQRDPIAGKRFVQKWKGFFKNTSIEDWRNDKIAYLEKKYQ